MGKLFSNRDKLKELPGALTLLKYNPGTTKVNDTVILRTVSTYGSLYSSCTWFVVIGVDIKGRVSYLLRETG
jgi:hypothetical protein